MAYFNVEGSTVHGEENFILVGIGIGCTDTVISCVDGDIPSVDGDRFSFETFDWLGYFVGSAIDDQFTRSMDTIVPSWDGHGIVRQIHGSDRCIFIVIHLDRIFICIDGHSRTGDIELIIDVEGISYSRDLIGSACDVESVIGLDPVVLLGINIERTRTIDGEVAFREDHRIGVFIIVWTGIRQVIGRAIC